MAEASATPIIETAPVEWRPVVGFEGRYEVSNRGLVRALWFVNKHVERRRITPKLLRGHLRNGYRTVKLSNRGDDRTEYVHALVAEAFIGPRPQGLQVAHLDGDKGNCVPANLAYVTHKENEAHKRVHGRDNRPAGPDAGGAKLTAAQVREMRSLRRRFGGKLPQWVLARMFDVTKWTVSDVCAGKSHQNVG